MKKRIFTLFALLVLLPVMVFATDVVITWEWMLDDPQVTAFRYQLDGEDPDNWTVVDSLTTSCVIQNLDGSTEYTLYLQQTYDGVNWSPSAVSTALPLIPKDDVAVMNEENINNDVQQTEEGPAVSEEATSAVIPEEKEMDELVADENVIVAETKAPKKAYYTSVSLRGSGVYALDTIPGAGTNYDNYSASVGLGLGFNNILSSKNVGLGLNIDTDLLLMPKDGSARASLFSFFIDNTITDYSLRVTLAPEVEFNFGKVTIDIAGLVDATLVDYPYVGTLDITPDYYSHFLLGYGGQLGLAYNVNNHLQIGVDGKFRRFGGNNGQWGAEVTPTLKLKF